MSSLAGWASSSAEDSIPKRLAAVEARLRELTSQRDLESATVGGRGLTSANFDGTLSPPTPGTLGWGLAGASGDAIFNNLHLRGGIVGNDALTNPVTGASFQSTNVAFGIGTGWATKVSLPILTPSGFSSAFFLAVAEITGVNPTANPDLLMMRLAINAGVPTAPQVNEAPASGYTQVTNSCAFSLGAGGANGPLTGTTTITLEAATVGAAWAAVSGSDNLAALSVMALYLR